ncbi:MAG: hypothetical protein K2Y23_17710, partial [Cyanobacteria bacterium]|nr:hypothetical protein [Cyanobacteriota bacterium]
MFIAVIVAIGIAGAQSYPDTVDGHVAAAMAAAGSVYGALTKRLCTAPAPPAPRNAGAAVHRNADIGYMDRRGVVDPIAQESDGMSAAAQR